jgi:predicted NodU family carbamoyl transferase
MADLDISGTPRVPESHIHGPVHRVERKRAMREDVSDWFELDTDSPYMLLVADVVKQRRRQMTAQEQALFGIDKLNVPRSDILAVTRVDYSARVQTVHAETNPQFHALLSTFKRKTGCPVLVNTSFNVRGEPTARTRMLFAASWAPSSTCSRSEFSN